MPFRIVGSHEYLIAINQLVPLVNESTASEIEVYNRILAEQDEFSFFSGVVLNAANNNDYRNSPKSIQATERFKRRKLSWLMALARLELAATMSMYGEAKNSFEFLAPDGFGRDEYFELLTHDLAVHIGALKTDPLLLAKSDATKGADSDTIAYARRLKIVFDMLLAARGTADGKFARSADEYLQVVYRFGVQLYRIAENSTGVSKETSTRIKTEEEYNSRNSIEAEAGTVTAVSDIVRACQRRFLKRYGRDQSK